MLIYASNFVLLEIEISIEKILFLSRPTNPHFISSLRNEGLYSIYTFQTKSSLI